MVTNKFRIFASHLKTLINDNFTKTITNSFAKAIACLPLTIQKWGTVQERETETLSKRGERTKWATIDKSETVALSKCGANDVWKSLQSCWISN